MKSIFSELNKIHQMSTSEVKEFWVPPNDTPFQNWKPFMLSNINLTLHLMKDITLDRKMENFIKSSLSFLKDYIRKGNYKVVPIHGDLAPGNIIISHKKEDCILLRIIDFERTRMGDRLWDLAYYWGWLERSNKKVAEAWRLLLAKKLSADELKVLGWYRILFHAWTVRDMFEYEEDKIRQERGESSKNILMHQS
ncbi:hypothetical protein COY15_05860 [Candidatus Roizmanbacteria bacterium CG_4_10_14_0_2_um_filter_39_12]|nr:MAG: hypothetical protein COY15_05860 [Candidatus Roizmanbacteria bacterium CG_4_10_14_0_2_um_filter_39_12]